MIPILTLAEMKEVEKRTTQEFGLSEFDMIMSAGEAIFATIKTMLEQEDFEAELGLEPIEEDLPGPLGESVPRPERREESVAFVCGPGHNGADGLAAALLTSQAGYAVVIYQTPASSERGFSLETERLHQQIADADLQIHYVRSPLDLPVFQDVSLIVDALLGTGLKREPEGLIQSCIYGMNKSGVPIVAVDLPSGIRCDTPGAGRGAIEATATICLGAMKISSAFYPACLAYGKVGYSPICFDEKLLMHQPSRLGLYAMDDAVTDYPERDYKANKYTTGKVLVIAGSRGMHGAAALSANAALRAGAGMIKLAYPAGIHLETTVHILEIIGVPVGAANGVGNDAPAHFRSQDLAELGPLITWADCVLVGPGLGKHVETELFVKNLMPLLKDKRTVVDGDALQFFTPDFASTHADLRGFNNFVLTPHAGEYQRMGGEYDYTEPLDLMRQARNFSQTRNLNLVLKGATTVLASPDGHVTAMPVGNPGMATAGSGDVLAGVIAGLYAVLTSEKACGLAVFAHGKAGDIARKDRGTLGMVASDLLLYIPMALMEIEEGGEDDPAEWIND